MAMPDGQALARKQQKEFTDTLAVLVQNPGMSFQKAAELTNYKPGTEIDDPAYQSTVDRSANFNWGADLPQSRKLLGLYFCGSQLSRWWLRANRSS